MSDIIEQAKAKAEAIKLAARRQKPKPPVFHSGGKDYPAQMGRDIREFLNTRNFDTKKYNFAYAVLMEFTKFMHDKRMALMKGLKNESE